MLALILGLLLCGADHDTDDEQVLRAIQGAYTANRIALPFGTVHFQYTVGKAANDRAARKGELSSAYVGEGLYVFDGPNGRYECVFPPEAEVAARVRAGEHSWSVPFGSFRVLTDGKVTLWDRISVGDDGKTVIRASQIDPGTENFFQFFSIVSFPLQLGNPHPRAFGELDQAIESVLRPSSVWKLRKQDEHAEWDGAPVIQLAFDVPPPRPSLEFWVDLEHGAVPRRMRMFDGKSAQTTDYDDLRHVAGKAWVPFRMTGFMPPSLTHQLVIQEADFDTPPPHSLFQLEFPETKKPMVNTAAGLRYEARKVWDLSRLPSPSSAGTKHVGMVAAVPMPPPMPGPREARTWWLPWVLATTGLLLVAGSLFFWLRRRGGRQQHA